MKSLNCSDGAIQGSGTMHLTSGATLRLSTANQKSLYRNFINNGTTIWEAGTIYMASGATFFNKGSFLDPRNTNNNFGYGGNASYFINDGEYIKSGTGVTTLMTWFTNNSLMDIQTGQVSFSRGGNSTGSILVKDGTLLKLASSVTLGGQVSGAGSVEFWSNISVQGIYNITGNTFFASYTTTFDDAASVVSLNHGQELQIPGHVEFNTGDAISIDSILLTGNINGSDSIAILKSLNWSGGTIRGSGTINLTSGATLRLSTSGQKSLFRNLVNNGTSIWEAGTIYMAHGVTFYNYGSFLDQLNTNNNLGYGGNTSYFTNDGEYIKSGTGLTNLVLGFSNMPGGEIQGAGTLRFSRAFSNEGTVSPGNSAGVLILRTDYPTTPTSKLNIEIGGTPTSENNDRLEITGDATLGGTLTISLIDNFVPAVGDTFEIVTYASYSEDFETINGLNTGTGVSFIVETGSEAIKLVAFVTPNSPPSEFSLLEPQDELVLSSYDTIDFSWNASTDVDNDQLEYILYIFGTSADTTIGSINETALEFISNDFLQSNTTYDWTVIVSDGTDTIASPDTLSFTTPVASSIEENFDWNSQKYSLSQNFPNPFTSNTTILFNIPVRESITLKVYDHLGREVLILIDEEKPAGGYKIEFDASSLDNGLYFYRFQAGDYVDTKTMILLK
ncbi:MAG: T9SS type A sorting domain-containing protein [Bacteroidales bacterium]|nr:T9SS type A sorting domain-containing protein [Bacteroidales bacterium]